MQNSVRLFTTRMQILGLETSCDETGIAIYDTSSAELINHGIYSQVDLHALFGGVVPELASRDHVRRLVPMIREVVGADIPLNSLDGVAYTAGPGLAGALMTGAVLGRSLAWSLGKPALGVHHMEGHLLAPLLESDPLQFPFVCLLVSGGHTMLVRVDAVGEYRMLGESLDDAAGEAFDKTAKLLGLRYPGGPELARLAEAGDEQRFAFPRPMVDRPGLDFSFSGLKTAAITRFRALEGTVEERADVAASFQLALVDTLYRKCRRALEQEQLSQLVVSGGVSANRRLRSYFTERLESAGYAVAYPRLEFCTDNGAMIALAGGLRLAAGQTDDLSVHIKPRWPLEQLSPINIDRS